MSTDIDLRVKYAKLETEFLELNLLADTELQQQRVAFDCQIALRDSMQLPEYRLMPPLD